MSDATARHLSSVADEDEDEITETKEGLDLRPNGTVRLYLDGTRYRLRRPRAREFRKLREAFQEAADEISELSDVEDAWKRQVDADQEARMKDDPAATWTAAQRKENRVRGREFTEKVERLMFEWWGEVVATLEVDGRSPLADDDDPYADMAMWMGTVPSASRIIAHWRAVPSLSGDR